MESNLLCIDDSNRKPVQHNNIDNDADATTRRCHILVLKPDFFLFFTQLKCNLIMIEIHTCCSLLNGTRQQNDIDNGVNILFKFYINVFCGDMALVLNCFAFIYLTINLLAKKIVVSLFIYNLITSKTKNNRIELLKFNHICRFVPFRMHAITKYLLDHTQLKIQLKHTKNKRCQHLQCLWLSFRKTISITCFYWQIEHS